MNVSDVILICSLVSLVSTLVLMVVSMFRRGSLVFSLAFMSFGFTLGFGFSGWIVNHAKDLGLV